MLPGQVFRVGSRSDQRSSLGTCRFEAQLRYTVTTRIVGGSARGDPSSSNIWFSMLRRR